MREITHLSLFSGIGGLDLAAEWAGFTTVGQCEFADYPTKVLEKHWPDVPRWRDIRTLTGESFYERTGLRTVDLISGGFPCQPFSVAGKQRGKEDDRYLWPEMVRVIQELRPTWIVGENVAGIVKLALADILSELEACGYRARTFLIPAFAVGARHRRYRVAIVGYSQYHGSSSPEVSRSVTKTGGRGKKGKDTTGESPGTGKPGNSTDVANTSIEGVGRLSIQPGKPRQEGTHVKWSSEDMANTESQRQQGNGTIRQQISKTRLGEEESAWSGRAGGTQEQEFERSDSYVSDSDDGSWLVRGNREFSTAKETGAGRADYERGTKEHESGQWRSTEPGLGGMANGIPDWLDGYWDVEPDIPRIAKGIPNRVGRLKCLGNAVVPQQFYPIFRYIAEIIKNEIVRL